jgi:hypothetical protein
MNKETAPVTTVEAEAASAAANPPVPARAAGRRRIPTAAYGILVIAVFAGVIGAGMASGTFLTAGKTTAGGERVAPQGVTVTEIKGWMTLGDVATAWGVPLEEIIAAFQLPSDTGPATAIKDLESDLFSVTALRYWLAARTGPTP